MKMFKEFEKVNYYEEYHRPLIHIDIDPDTGAYKLMDEDVKFTLDIPFKLKHLDVHIVGRQYVIFYDSFQEYYVAGKVDTKHFMTRKEFKDVHGQEKEFRENYDHEYVDIESEIMKNWDKIQETYKDNLLETLTAVRKSNVKPPKRLYENVQDGTDDAKKRMKEEILNRAEKMKKKKTPFWNEPRIDLYPTK